jgi:serine/threonine protein kinase
MGNCLEICTPDKAAATAAGPSSPDNKQKQQSQPQQPHGRQKLTPQQKQQAAFNKERRSTIHSIHDAMLHEKETSVHQKYDEVEVLGTGSMGHVSKVRVKEGSEAGSTYRAVTTSRSGSNEGSRHGEARTRTLTPSNSNISDRSRRVFYALKSIQLDRVSPTFVEELKNEIDILKTMDHPNIVRLNEVYYHKKQIHMILELCDGGKSYYSLCPQKGKQETVVAKPFFHFFSFFTIGDLYTRLPYTEKDAAYITGKLLSAIKYMHDHGIVHRDRTYSFQKRVIMCATYCSNSQQTFWFFFSTLLFFISEI